MREEDAYLIEIMREDLKSRPVPPGRLQFAALVALVFLCSAANTWLFIWVLG